jgi:hypothetical protein
VFFLRIEKRDIYTFSSQEEKENYAFSSQEEKERYTFSPQGEKVSKRVAEGTVVCMCKHILRPLRIPGVYLGGKQICFFCLSRRRTLRGWAGGQLVCIIFISWHCFFYLIRAYADFDVP